jgi:hypothetical protein
MGQAASGGEGKAAGQSYVTFSRGAAQRIAKTVRTVEAGDRNQPGLRFDHPQFGASGKFFRVCTYTGSWSVGSSKTVTFKYQTATPNTAVATNLFFPVTGTASADCAIAKDGTAWFLIDVPFYTATGVFVQGTSTGVFAQGTTSGVSVTGTAASSYLTDISISGSLNTTNCTITIGKTLTTSSSVFVTGTASAIFVTSTATASFVTTSRTATFILLEKP